MARFKPTGAVAGLILALGSVSCTGTVSTLEISGGPDGGEPDSGLHSDAGEPVGVGDAGKPDAGVFIPAIDAGTCTLGVDYPPFPDNRSFPNTGPAIACPAGTAVVTNIDSAIAQMAPGTWKELPCTQMANVCPPPYSPYACGAVMAAWSSAAYDTVREQLVVFGGGHADSYYNNVFGFDLATASWRRWSPLPPGLTGDTFARVFADKRVESCGLYPATPNLCIPNEWLSPLGYMGRAHCTDPRIQAQLNPQAPRSAHTYGNIAFSAATGDFYVLGSTGIFQSGQSTSSRLSIFNFSTRMWRQGTDNPSPGYGTSATDPQGFIWYSSGNNDALLKFDPNQNTWTPQTSLATHGYYALAAVDSMRNVLVVTQDGIDLATYALGTPGAPYTNVQSTGLSAALPGVPGLEYLSSLDRFVAWSGGRNLYYLNPANWSWKTVAAGGDGPGPGATAGTFGRFRYSPAHHVFVGVSTTDTNVFIYKPPTSAP